jgi:hypothetical protein
VDRRTILALVFCMIADWAMAQPLENECPVQCHHTGYDLSGGMSEWCAERFSCTIYDWDKEGDSCVVSATGYSEENSYPILCRDIPTTY